MLSESYQLPLGAAPLYLCLLRRNSCAAGGVLFSYSGAIFERSKTLSIDYSGANIHVFRRKSPLCRSHFFEWLKTAISSTACGRVTLKSLLPQGAYAPHVHPRLRKCRSRCTLDCGFKTSESPALRGFVAERAPIRGTSLYLVLKSNGFRHSKNLPVKFGFLPKTIPATIAKKLPPQRCFKPLFIAIFNFAHKRPTFAFTSESGYTLAFRRRIAHNGSHGETGAFRTGPLSLPSTRTARLRTSPGRVSERRTLPLWDLGREVLSKNAESLRDSDALMRVAVPRRCGPAGLRDPVAIVSMIKNMINPWAGSFLIFCWANANSIKKVVLQPF